MEHKVTTLKNGLRVVLVPLRDAKTATVLLMVGTGSRYENKSENGLAHFLEHMFFKGTKRRPTARAITTELDGIGGAYNAFTGKNRTAYYAKISKEHIETALDVVSDIFLNSVLSASEIEKERGAIIQEINMYEDMPMRSVGDVFETLLFGESHPLGRTILGPKENILSFTRTDFSRYLARCYSAQNTVVCIAGAFPESKVLVKIKKDFSKVPVGTLPPFTPFTPSQKVARVHIKNKKTDQTQLVLGVLSYPFKHKDEYVLEVLTTVLGIGMSSRLFTEVRERRGLAYFIRASLEKFSDTGYFAVQAGVEHSNLHKAVGTIMQELRKIKRFQVTPAELTKAKEHLKGSLALSLETPEDLAGHAATSLTLLGRVETLEGIKSRVDAVTAGDVQRVARDLFKTQRLNLAIIGPHAKEKPLLSLLRA
ncbi:insulinase family protein [Patescibacteria group bacterium]|nr:insulinase family protein [Patescibacteria group bacterium]